ncbi:ATP-binding protein [Amycolatopsis sp. cmx-11-12]|uniref:ATP-binding protein n=1 Tax=Amycolatopsis sp. cmx-11-12 TaxID=2785795 RepID=UPI003917DEF9
MTTAAEAKLSSRLPAEVTSYVGREAEIREARRRLGAGSVVTLTGPGGVGKTRMAVRLARTLSPDFTDGAVFVSLAELHDPDLLPGTIAEELDLADSSTRPPLAVLVEGLRTRRTLLVLDNCEHLVEACARLIATVVRECPDVVLLATSRQSLGVAGEQILPLSPLDVPVDGTPTKESRHAPAVQLFADRASAVVSSFKVAEDNVDDVLRLCRALEGLPLAIELAAVRLRVLSVGEIADRLNEQFTLLTAGGPRVGLNRHETLRALTDWSYRLCTSAEQLLWARLSVFAHDFDLSAAEDVCTGEGLDPAEVLDVLDGLLDKSVLLRVEQHGVVRYRLLETLRQFGEEKLAATGELLRLRRRHRDWCLRLVDRYQRAWIGPDQLAWSARLRREHPNLRTALDFCAEDPNDAVVGLSIAVRCKEFWLIRGITAEGRLHLRKLLDLAPKDVPERAHALWTYAFLAQIQGDRPAYEQTIAEAAAVSEAVNDVSARAYTLLVRGYDALIGNRMSEAAALFEESTALHRGEGDLGGELWARYNYGISFALAGRLEQGREVLRDCVDELVARGEIFWRSWALWSLAAVEYLVGDIDQARAACHETLRLERQLQDRAIVAFALTVTAGVAAHTGQDRRAAKLFGAAAAVWASVGASPTRYEAFIRPMEKDTELVTGRLGLDAAAAEFTAGYALSIDAAVAYALDDGADSAPRGPLTKRETEVAHLVAQGMTNRQIAETLVISQRTASTHVDHILTKLSFHRRSQIAAWIAKGQPGQGEGPGSALKGA